MFQLAVILSLHKTFDFQGGQKKMLDGKLFRTPCYYDKTTENNSHKLQCLKRTYYALVFGLC